jgi:hypothetical protein
LRLLRSERLPYIAAAAVALLLLSQAMRLEDFGPFGPGAGIFPQITAGLAAALALALVLVPALGREAAAPGAAEEPVGPEERRTFHLYIAGLVLMVVGSAFLGFAVTTILLALLIAWLAERRPFHSALLFGLACAVIGTIGLGHYMEIEMPYAAADSLLRSLVR